jgi:hypothetical protein
MIMIKWNTTNEPHCHEDEDAPLLVAIFCLVVIFISFTICVCASVARSWTEEIATAAQQTTSEEDKKTRKERISKVLVVRKWAPGGASVETGPSDSNPIPEDGSERKPPAPQDDVEAPCAIGSDEYESFSEKIEERAGCAICLGEFQDHQLVCESNNPSCQHVFHKDCMVGWLTTKQHDDCPCCRETYLL